MSEGANQSDVVLLAEFASRQHALLLQVLLQDAGVMSDVRVGLSDDGEPETAAVFVPEARSPDAARILNDFQATLEADEREDGGPRSSYQAWAVRSALRFAFILFLIALVLLLFQLFREWIVPGALPTP